MSLAQSCYFSKTQLRKLQQQFCHTSADKLYIPLMKTRSEDLESSTLDTLEYLTGRCDPYQRIHLAPTRFMVSLGSENEKFNDRLIIVIMFLINRPVVHFVHDGTHFSVTGFALNCGLKHSGKPSLRAGRMCRPAFRTRLYWLRDLYLETSSLVSERRASSKFSALVFQRTPVSVLESVAISHFDLHSENSILAIQPISRQRSFP